MCVFAFVKVVTASARAKQEIQTIKITFNDCMRLYRLALLNEFHFTARSYRALFLFAVTIADLHTTDHIANYRKIIIGFNAIALRFFFVQSNGSHFRSKRIVDGFGLPHRT